MFLDLNIWIIEFEDFHLHICVSTLNPFKPNDFPTHQFGQSISVSLTSDLDLHCLPLSHKKDARYMVKLFAFWEALHIFCVCDLRLFSLSFSFSKNLTIRESNSLDSDVA